MAVTLTRAQLAVELRLVATETDTVPAGQGAVLDRAFAAATALVTDYATAAPDAVANEAVVRLASRLYDQAGSEGRGGNPMVQSGAAALLSRYRTRAARTAAATSPRLMELT